MAYYKDLKKLSKKAFKRFTGTKKLTFNVMVNVIKEVDIERQKRGGRKRYLSYEDIILMTLKYWREYSTYFHIGKEYGISESQCYKIIKWVEENLSKSSLFTLKGKEYFLNKDNKDIDVVVIDVSEISIQRPKKNKKSTIQEKKRNIPLRPR